MRRYTILLTVALVFAVGCGSGDSDKAATPSAPPGISATTLAPTTLSVGGVPSPTVSSPDAPTGTILMIKLYVGDDIAAGEKFYGAVFGAKPTLTVGDNAHILTLPKGGPGLVLIKATPDSKDRKGGFIIQVPDIEATQALALANGATFQQEFAGTPGGQASQSVDLLDPWGNQVEILLLGTR